jgi:hypothetical protein
MGSQPLMFVDSLMAKLSGSATPADADSFLDYSPVAYLELQKSSKLICGEECKMSGTGISAINSGKSIE